MRILERRRRVQFGAVAAIVAVGLAVPLSPAGAASHLAVSPSSAAPGATVAISGNVAVSGAASCAAGDPAQLTSSASLFPPDGFGPQAPRDAGGNFSTSYAIPASTPAGDYSIGVRCGGGNVGISATLHVTAPPSPTTAAPTTVAPTTTTPTTTAPTTSAPPTTAASSSPSTSVGPPITVRPATSSGGGSPLWIAMEIALVVLLLLIVAVLILALRRKRARHS